MRRRAEQRLEEQGEADRTLRIQTDAQRIIHELHVHQIELEMQNEELRIARDKAEILLEKYTNLYDFAPIGYFSMDAEGCIREVNLTGAGLLGAPRSTLMEQNLAQFITPQSRPVFLSYLEKVFAQPGRLSCEVGLLRGGETAIEVRLEAEMIASKTECLAIMEDITRQKQTEKDRLILNKLESTGILAGGIAHDFNNLLTVISLNLELAHALTPPEGHLTNYLEQAESTALIAHGLTQQLITFSKGGEPNLQPAHLSSVIRESARAALSGSSIQCSFSLAADLWPAKADARQIEQVIRNLILNAREAMPENGMIAILAENVMPESGEQASTPQARAVRISISDQGGGIAKEVLPKIFDPYFSTKKRGSQKGMGLGLTICHTIVTKHGGTLAVSSVQDAGATFTIQLPACPEIPVETKPPMSTRFEHPIRILVMDDEEGLRHVLGLLLHQLGHEVELAAEGKNAVELYGEAQRQSQPFDLVILDLTIRNGMGGLDTIQALLKINPSVVAIVMSGYADDPVIADPVRYGFKGALVKPFESDSLKDCIYQTIKSCPVGMSRHE